MNIPTPDELAAEWLVRRDRGLTPAEQDDFLQWLAADPRHRVVFITRRKGADLPLLLRGPRRPEGEQGQGQQLLLQWHIGTMSQGCWLT